MNRYLGVTLILILSSCAHEKVISNRKSNVLNPYKDLKIQGDTIQEKFQSAKYGSTEAKTYLASELFLKAQDLSATGLGPQALNYYRMAYELSSEDSYLLKKYTVEMIKSGDLEKAKEHLEAKFDKQKNVAQDREGIAILLAGVYAALDKGEKARSIYEKIIKESEDFQEACVFLARNLANEKKFKEGQGILDKCIKKDSSEPVYTFYKGKLYQDEGKRELAQKFYQATLKKDPDFFQATLALGSMFEEKENYKAAIKIYKNYVDSDYASNPHPVLTKLVQAMFNAEMNKEVIPFAERLVSLDDNDLTTKVRLGLLYVDEENYSKAIALFKEVLEVVPESDKVLYYLAALYQETNELVLAEEYFAKINDSSPLFYDSLMQRSEILSIKAKSIYKSSKKESPDFLSFIDSNIAKYDDVKVELSMIKANYLEEAHRFSDAVKVMADVKTHKKFQDGHDYYLASLLEKSGNKIEARAIITSLIKKDPNNAHALNFLGYSLLEQNESLDLAYTYISKAVKLRPEDGYIRDSMAWYFYKVGRFDQALAEATKAYELINNDVTITKHLGMIYERLNKVDKARAFYNQALVHAEQMPTEREEILKNLQQLEQKRLPASVVMP